MKKRVGVIFGGRSGEHEISIRSARSVIEQADAAKYDIVPLAIDQSGRWLAPADSLALLPQETQDVYRERYGEPATDGGGLSLLGGALTGVRASDTIDVAFPVLHGPFGEDGTIQGLFEMAGVPYVGCGVLASSSGMDKAFMKTLLADAGLPICKYVWFLRDEWDRNNESVVKYVETKLGFPCFVKPANLGSSVGVSRAEDADDLGGAIALAAEYDRKVVVEEAVNAREIECGVMGNDNPEGSTPGEYIIRDETKTFLNYNEKYAGTGNNEFVVPAAVSDELASRIKQMAVTAFKAIDGSGLARVDFFLRNDTGTLLVNEINTMPGLTDASGFPKMWQGSGKEFTQVIDELVQLALDRSEDKKRNKTNR
jgi:D-alanine-D-alanine ligase